MATLQKKFVRLVRGSMDKDLIPLLAEQLGVEQSRVEEVFELWYVNQLGVAKPRASSGFAIWAKDMRPKVTEELRGSVTDFDKLAPKERMTMVSTRLGEEWQKVSDEDKNALRAQSNKQKEQINARFDVVRTTKSVVKSSTAATSDKPVVTKGRKPAAAKTTATKANAGKQVSTTTKAPRKPRAQNKKTATTAVAEGDEELVLDE